MVASKLHAKNNTQQAFLSEEIAMKHGSWAFVSLAILLVCEAFSVHVGFAQVGGNASISGIVQDQSKALIPGVSVTLTNVETGVMATTVTNESGAYGFPSITPGKYSLSGSLPGFKTTKFNDLDIGNVQVRQDITLEVAAAGTAIEVTATADTVLRESSASIGDVLTQQRAQELPLVGANILDLMQVMPGMKTGNFTVVGAFDTDTFAGQYANTVNVTRNGMSVNNGFIESNPDSGTGAGQFNFAANCTLTGLAAIVPSSTPGAYPVLDASGNPTGKYAVNVLQNSMPGQLPAQQTPVAAASNTRCQCEQIVTTTRGQGASVPHRCNERAEPPQLGRANVQHSKCEFRTSYDKRRSG
jgi:hypothetical protein